MGKRSASSRLFFYYLYGEGATVQVMADARNSADMKAVEFWSHADYSDLMASRSKC